MTHDRRPDMPEERARFRRIERPGHPDGDLYLWIDRWHSEPAPAWWWNTADARDTCVRLPTMTEPRGR